MSEPQYKSPDKFDRMIGALTNLPDVVSAGPSTVMATSPLIGSTQTFIIKTLRQRENGDTIFLQAVDEQGSIRIVIPPAAADAIARQRDQLTTKSRKRHGKAVAAARKAAGLPPAFMVNRGKGKPKGKPKAVPFD